MLDDVLHNQCVQDMDVDQVMAEVAEEGQVIAAGEEQVMAEDVTETDLPEINTKERVVHGHHTEDRIVITKRNGNLTLKDKD